MEEEKIKQNKSKFKTESGRNIYYYGEEFGISVESNQGEYTCVKVRFPVLQEEV